MKEEKDYNHSLFSRFIGLIFLTYTCVIFSISWKIEDVNSKLSYKNLIEYTRSINHILTGEFHSTENKIRSLAFIIFNRNGEISDNEMLDLLQIFSDRIHNKLTLWIPIGWANNNHTVKLYAHGDIKEDINLSYRQYINNIVSKDFRLFFSTKDKGYITKRSIIPAALGIKTKEGKYLGCLTTGIDLDYFKSKMNTEILSHDSNTYYAIINTLDNDIVINSPNFNIKKLTGLQKDIADFMNKDNNSPFISDKEKYIISNISNFPLLLITGNYPKSLSLEERFYSLLPYKFELIILLMIIFSFIYLFYFSILGPLLKLSEAAVSISGGDMNTIIPQANSKEGIALANALEKIKLSFKTEKKLTQEISEAHNKLSITNLRLENKVIERTKELNESLSTKTSFLTDFSHQVRTPIQGMSNISESLIKEWEQISEDKKFDFAHQIAYSSKHLLNLIINLLDFSKLSHSKMTINTSKFDITNLTKEVIEECNLLYLHNKPIKINFVSDKSFFVIADKERLKQVIHNLLVNAIKFTPKKGFISINIISTKILGKDGRFYDSIQFTINDQGIGISESELTSIFAPFSQGKEIKYQAGAIGLGLAISLEVISAHNGKIWAYNNKDGGASFNFIIPIVPISEQTNNNLNAISIHNDLPNILIIDDDESCLTSMEILLYDSKYNLIKANSAQNGLKYLQEHASSISIILLDLMMPDIYGLNVLDEINNNSNTCNIPVILQTGSSDEEEIIKAFNKGISSFIRKPYRKKVILKKIEKALNSPKNR